MNGDKPPKRPVWDKLSRHLPRKSAGGETAPPATPPPAELAPPSPPPTPPPAARVTVPSAPGVPASEPRPPEPEAPARAPETAPLETVAAPESGQAADLRKKLGAVFTAPPAEEERKGAGAPLPAWNKEAFTLTPEQAAREADPGLQMSRLLDHARKRPVLSSFVLLFVVGVLVYDSIALMRRFGLDEYLMVSADLGPDASHRFDVWQRRASGLGFIAGAPGHEKEVVDPLQQAAVDGKEKLPDKPLTTPGLSGGLAGIVTPEELRDGTRASLVSGLDGALDSPDDAVPMTHAFLKTAKDDFAPYAPAAKGAKSPPYGVYFGRAGEALENYGTISNAASPAPGYGSVDGSQRRRVPQGLHGNDLVSAMLDPDLSQSIQQYSENKAGDWKLHKMDQAEATPRPELAGITLLDNAAVLQLLETKQSTDRGLDCETCDTMTRVWDDRAPFYGEQH